jgi:uncharacterized protein YqjF (DUF2071 family)
MPRAFLTAQWRNLFLATYSVPPAVLEPRLPPELQLDLREGQAFVSLVAFEFLDTRVLGIPWPGYRDFPELNLRFYVRHGEQRGVVFIREFVPKRLITWIARWIYNEPYRPAPMSAIRTEEAGMLTMEYRLRWGGKDHLLAVTGRKAPFVPEETSTEHFFKEHSWGFGTTRRGKTLRYQVSHPVWEVLPVERFTIDLDWGPVYGPEWAFLNTAQPMSTILAVGSPVSVYPQGAIVHKS